MDDGGTPDGGVVAEVMAKHGRSAQPESLQVVAVLQALKEVVAGEGLTVTPTSLFAAAMSALEKPETQASAQVCQAMCTLLAMVLPRVPNSVLRSKFVGCSALLCRVLEVHRQQAAVAKCTLQCLCQVLAALDPTNWPAAMAPFSMALSFVTDNRPKVRRRADIGMVEVLAALQGTPGLAPASDAIAKLCQAILPGPEAAARAAAAASNKNRAAAEAAISKSVADTLHVLGMLKGCIALMAPQPIKSVVDLLFKLYPLKQQLLSRHATEVLTQLCGSGAAVPTAGTAASAHLAPSTLAEILTVVLEAGDQLWDRRDADTVLHLTRLVEAGFIRLAQADPALCAQRLPRAFHALVPQLCAEQDGVRFGTSQALRNLIVDCVDERMMVPAAASGGKAQGAAPLASVVAAVQSSLSARFQDAWPLALPVVGTMLTRLGELPEGYKFSEGLLTTLGSILSGQQDAAEEQEQADDGVPLTSAVSTAADAALGAALRALGPDVVLQVLPLNLESAGQANVPPGSEPRTWLLPMLRRHVCGTKLGFWGKTLLPLAKAMAARSEAAAAAGRNALSQACHVLELQLWHCLPAFCSWATDLPEAYALYVKDMAAAFQNREDLRPSVGQALERMCIQVRRALKASGNASLVSASEPLGALSHEEDEEDEEGGGFWAQRARGAEEEERLHEVPPSHYKPETAEAALGALRAWSKNWLVLLFKVFLDQDPHTRGPTAVAISAACSLAEPAVLAPLFKTVITRLIKIQKDAAAEVPPPDMITDGGQDPTQRSCAFLELALCSASGLDDTGLTTLVKAALPGMTSTEPALQKKAYKVLAYVCQHRPSYLRSHLAQILPAVLGGTTGALSASKRYRLRCLQPLVQLLANPAPDEQEEEEGGVLAGLRAVAAAAAGDDSDEEVQDANVNVEAKRNEVIVALVSEIVLSVKEANVKTRAIAYSLLIQLAHAMDEADPSPNGKGGDDSDGDMAVEEAQGGSEGGGLHKLFSIVMAGLVGSTPHMISATVMALARLLYEFASRLEGTVPRTVPRLLPAVLMLLRTRSREVVKSVLGFVKVCAMRMPVELLLPQLKAILEGLLIWAEDSKNKFKLKVRVVVERLARRCGFDEIAQAMPPSDSKLLTHIRKQHNRKQRRKAGSDAGSEEDFEGDEETKSRSGASRSGAKSVDSARSSMARTARTSEWAHSRVFSDEEEEGQGARSAHGGKAGARSAPGSSRGRASAVRLSEGAGDDPMDLLDASASRRLVRTSAGANRRPAGAGDGAAAFRRDEATGKMVFEEEEGEGGRRGAKRRRGRDEHDYDSQDSDFEDLRGVADLGAAMKSAAKSVHFAKSIASSQGAKSQGGRSMGGKSMGGRSDASRGSAAAAGKKGPAKHSGDRYKPKKGGAGGDATGKAKVEPYAYWQFDRKMLNRRRAKQAGASKGLAGVVKAAQAGAARGAKAKRQRTN